MIRTTIDNVIMGNEVLIENKALENFSKEANDTVIKLNNEYKAFKLYLSKNNLKFNDLKEEDLKKYIFSRADNTSYRKITKSTYLLTKFFKSLEIDVPVKEYIKEFVDLKDKDMYNFKKVYITKDDIDEIDFINASDEFMVRFYFMGINDPKDEGLRNLKIRDIDFVNKKMLLSNQTIDIDDKLAKSILETINSTVYIGSLKNEPKRCSLNENSLYILRSKRTDATKDGTTPLSYNSMRFRLQTINKQLGTDFSKNSLKVSGIAHTLYALNSENGYWTVPKIRKWKKESETKNTFSEIDVYNVLEKLYYNPL